MCGVGVRFCVGFGVYAGQSSTLAFCPLENLADKLQKSPVYLTISHENGTIQLLIDISVISCTRKKKTCYWRETDFTGPSN